MFKKKQLFSVAPFINKHAMSDIKLKVGQTIQFEVPIGGEPPPEVIWTVKDIKISPSLRTSIKTIEKASGIFF